MISKKLLSLTLAALILVSAALVGCNKEDPNDDFDPDTPGDDFSGSISKDDETKEEKPEEPVDEGDENQTYYISNADELIAMKRKGTYILTADIDMTGKEWTPVGTFEAPFVGKLDGAGFTIKGLTVTKDTEGAGECISYTYTYAGLIGVADGAEITNVKLENVNINISSATKTRVVYAGAIAAMTNGCRINGCEIISGSIKSSSVFFKAYSAGITAFSFDSDIYLCSVNADISVTDSKLTSAAGGIAAQVGNNTVIATCSTKGSVSTVSTDGNAYSGGLVGLLNNSDISHSAVKADVRAETKCSAAETGKAGASYAGGITAYANNSLDTQKSMTAVSSQGTVTAVSADYVSYAGGISAFTSYIKLTEAYSAAAVSSESNSRKVYAGGITGYVSTQTEYRGIFFAGSITARSSKDSVQTGVIIAYDATLTAENKAIFEKIGHITATELSVTVNGKKYTVGSTLPEKEYFVRHGEEYSASELRSRNILTGDLGWNTSNWSFSMSDYPTVNFEGYFECEIPEK